MPEEEKNTGAKSPGGFQGTDAGLKARSSTAGASISEFFGNL
jgi:hypothetical protein